LLAYVRANKGDRKGRPYYDYEANKGDRKGRPYHDYEVLAWQYLYAKALIHDAMMPPLSYSLGGRV